jgi:hypothetical protein
MPYKASPNKNAFKKYGHLYQLKSLYSSTIFTINAKMSSNNKKTRKKHMVNSVLLGCNDEIIIMVPNLVKLD